MEVRDLSFAYGGSMVLQRVNACFTAGNISAIVGESGSGKSTLLKVISGLYIPTNGGVCLHMEDSETDIQEIGCGYCAYVPPDQLIFRDTVAGNICMAQSREDEKMTQCAKMANIWEYIEGLDQGFETWIGDGEQAMSSGQMQRIAIARALYQGKKVMLFDEPTANLDEESIQIFIRTL